MLIKAALCEDNPLDQQEVQRLLQSWAMERGHQLELSIFSDTTKLSGAIDESYDSFDVYFLDIEMRTPQEGLDLARVIQQRAPHIPVVFITSHLELSYDSYEVQALHFLAKPIKEERLRLALDSLVKLLLQRKEATFTCTIEGELRRFALFDIRFFQTDGHYLLLNGDPALRLRLKLSELVAEYPEQFVICYQSYAVNIAHIHSILFSSLKVRLSDGSELPASKAHLVVVRQKFLEYFKAAGS